MDNRGSWRETRCAKPFRFLSDRSSMLWWVSSRSQPDHATPREFSGICAGQPKLGGVM